MYRLRKRSWDTFDLLDVLARRLHVRRGDISLGGIKDRHGDTTQHVAIPDRADLPDTVTSRFHGHAELKTDYGNYMRPGAATMEDAARKVHRLLSGEDPSGA